MFVKFVEWKIIISYTVIYGPDNFWSESENLTRSKLNTYNIWKKTNLIAHGVNEKYLQYNTVIYKSMIC